jgi:hypothetical protein
LKNSRQAKPPAPPGFRVFDKPGGAGAFACLPDAPALCALFFLALSGCGRYSDFTLPDPGPAQIKPDSFDWKPEPAPVLSPGDWDSVDVLSPSVVRRDNLYYNLYSGYDGKTWHTGLATSPDGAHWQKQGKILSPQPDTWEGNYIAGNGSALYDGGEFL